MKKATTFEDLIVWQKAHRLVLYTYKITKLFPNEEKFGLTSQLRRASVSVTANIAESFRKFSTKEKVHFLNISHCSLDEVKYYFILAKDLNFTKNELNVGLVSEVSKLLTAYKKAIVKST